MEIKALEQLLEILPVGRDVTIHIDNVYVVNTLVKNKDGETLKPKKFTGWISGWKDNDWKKANGDVPAHLKLWKMILEKIKAHLESGTTITIKWVKGHAGDKGNELADTLANRGCAQVMSKKG
jgi:ribonuclease HI